MSQCSVLNIEGGVHKSLIPIAQSDMVSPPSVHWYKHVHTNQSHFNDGIDKDPGFIFNFHPPSLSFASTSPARKPGDWKFGCMRPGGWDWYSHCCWGCWGGADLDPVLLLAGQPKQHAAEQPTSKQQSSTANKIHTPSTANTHQLFLCYNCVSSSASSSYAPPWHAQHPTTATMPQKMAAGPGWNSHHNTCHLLQKEQQSRN